MGEDLKTSGSDLSKSLVCRDRANICTCTHDSWFEEKRQRGNEEQRGKTHEAAGGGVLEELLPHQYPVSTTPSKREVHSQLSIVVFVLNLLHFVVGFVFKFESPPP